MHRLKYLSMIFFLLLGLGSLNAQVLGGEYFWNTDPGPGNGTPLSAADGNFEEAVEELLGTGIMPPGTGPQKFMVRAMDNCGDWGPVYTRVINFTDSTLATKRVQVTLAEYYWDTDPGAGGGTSLLAFDGNFNEAIEQAFTNSATLPGAGIHLFGIRVRDERGVWGPVYKRVVNLNDNLNNARPFNVAAAEYFWDTDPGAGSGNTLLAFDGNFNEAIEQAFTNSATLPGAGIHLFGIRVQDESAEWGPVFKRVVNLNDNLNNPRPFNVSAAEYFWDTDPGAGSGNTLLAFDGNFNEAIEQAFTNSATLPGAGIHLFGIRVQDESAEWGPVFKRVVNLNDNLNTPRPFNVSAAEYFWDTDPGKGSATTMLAFDGNFNEAVEQAFTNSATLPAQGTHLFVIRVRDESGVWGPDYKRVVNLNDNLNTGRPFRISMAEYFWDTIDPGPGNGYPLMVVDGSYDQALEAVFDSNLTLTFKGLRLFNIRVQDEYGQWGPLYKRPVMINVPYSLFAMTVSADTTICLGDTATLIASGAGSYTWSPGGSLDTTIGSTVQAFPNTTTTYTVIGQGAPGQFDTLTVTVTVTSGPAVSIGPDTSICPRDTIVLDAGTGFNSYLWSTGDTTQSISVDSGGTYIVEVYDTSACPGFDTIVVTQDTAINPMLTPSDTVLVCGGDSISIKAPSGFASYLWNTGDTIDSIWVSTPGDYYVTVSNGGGCAGNSDTTTVLTFPGVAFNVTPPGPVDTCLGYTVTLKADSGFVSYLWSTGSTLDSLDVTTTGSYNVAATDSNGCVWQDTVEVNFGPIPVRWTDMVNAFQSNDTIFETTGANSWGTKGAASAQVLQPGNDGFFYHVIENTKQTFFIGFSYQNVDLLQASIDHAFRVRRSNLTVREASGTNVNVGSISAGDTIAIARVGSTLNWLVNGVPVYSTPVNPNLAMMVDLSMFRKNTYLTDVYVSFCESTLPFVLEADVRQNICSLDPYGRIEAQPSGGMPPYTYQWNTGDTTQVLDSLNMGTYSVVVTDMGGNIDSLEYEIYNRVTWKDLVGATDAIDTLSRVPNNSSWGTSGAASEQVLLPNNDGWFMHVVHDRKYYYVGLSESNPDPSQLTIDYAFYVAGFGLNIREESTGMLTNYGTVAPGDTLVIERSGSNILYYHNGVLLRTTPTNAGSKLLVDVALYSKKTTIYDNFVSFCNDSVPPSAFTVNGTITHGNCYPSPNGSVTLNVSGGFPPYTYNWSSGETTSFINNKAPGLYTAIVADQMGNADTVDFEVLAYVLWEGFVGSMASNDTLYRTVPGAASWCASGARSDNKILNGLDGKVVHVVRDPLDYYYLGLSDDDTDACQKTIDYSFYVQLGQLNIREQKTPFFGNFGTVAAGDTLVVERRISSVYYYKNDSLLRSIGVSPAETLRVDVSMYNPNMWLTDVYVDFCDTVPGQKMAGNEGGAPGEQTPTIFEGQQVSLFPNPNSGSFTVEISRAAAAPIRLRLVDMYGREIHVEQVEHDGGMWRKQFRFTDVTKGVYFLRIEHPEGETIKKVMIEE